MQESTPAGSKGARKNIGDLTDFRRDFSDHPGEIQDFLPAPLQGDGFC